MADSHRTFEQPESGLEAMIFAAGNHMEVSEDLRPAVLEATKSELAASCAHRWGAILSTVVVLCALLVSVKMNRTDVEPRDGLSGRRSLMHATARELELAAVSGGPTDSSWALVELFQLLQSERSAAIRGAR